MGQQKDYDLKAHDWLRKTPPTSWSRAHFLGISFFIFVLLVCGYIADINLSLIVYQKTGRAKCEIRVNNLCESLNSKLLDGRDKPIVGCLNTLESIR